MATLNSELAFGSVIPGLALRPKPREIGLTELRSPGHGTRRIRDYVGMLGPYLDTVRWSAGMQRIAPRDKVREINAFLAENTIGASSGDLLTSIARLGDDAVRAFIAESKDLGFTTIDVPHGDGALSLEQKLATVRAAGEVGLKAKAELRVGGAADVEAVAEECRALLDAGAWKVTIGEAGVFGGSDPEGWNRAFVFALAARVDETRLFWEVSNSSAGQWLLAAFGPDVNLALGAGSLVVTAPGQPHTTVFAYLTSARMGIFTSTMGRIGGYGRSGAE